MFSIASGFNKNSENCTGRTCLNSHPRVYGGCWKPSLQAVAGKHGPRVDAWLARCMR